MWMIQHREEIAAMKGTPTEPGKDSPYRNRSVEENLDLFARMKNGEFADGSRTLRAKIDMAHPNMLMRDPVIVSYQTCASSPHRRQMVHLPDVRYGAWTK